MNQSRHPAARERARAPASRHAHDHFVRQFDDAALERALRTVSCKPQDVAHYLRSLALR